MMDVRSFQEIRQQIQVVLRFIVAMAGAALRRGKLPLAFPVGTAILCVGLGIWRLRDTANPCVRVFMDGSKLEDHIGPVTNRIYAKQI
jgi:hypothetical protein